MFKILLYYPQYFKRLFFWKPGCGPIESNFTNANMIGTAGLSSKLPLPSTPVGSFLVRVVVSSLVLLVALRYAAGLAAWNAANRLERPLYSVIRRLPGGVEVRRYEPYLIAETEVAVTDKEGGGGFRGAGGDGFRVCAGYIFGKNKGKDMEAEKMAMTSPVRASGCGVGGLPAPKSKVAVSFVVSSKYSLSTAPKPLDRGVRVKKVPSHVLAAKKFSGPPPKDERVEKERAKIVKALEAANLRVGGKRARDGGETLVYGYHDPVITPNLLRKNEVAVMVDESSLN